MSTVLSSFVTITCDADGCDKSATFPQTPEGEKEAMQEHVWINSLRFVQTPDGRKFTYCSDECEIKSSAAGVHNKQVIVPAKAENEVAMAAQAAERARKATEALKSGQGKVVLG